MKRGAPILIAVALSIVAGLTLGCSSGGGDRPVVRISAAASLKEGFTAYGDDFAPGRAAFSFAGSDELAAQIRAGARPDVFASADTQLPGALFADGLVGRPVPFAASRLVLAVPADGAVRSLAAAARPGVKVVVGSPSVPVGSYTRKVLSALAPALARGLEDNVRSREPDVRAIVAKLTRGAADAGFTYTTDVAATGGRLRAIELPPAASPRVVYAAAVVEGSEHPEEAAAFVRGLRAQAGRRALRDAGFEDAPR